MCKYTTISPLHWLLPIFARGVQSLEAGLLPLAEDDGKLEIKKKEALATKVYIRPNSKAWCVSSEI